MRRRWQNTAKRSFGPKSGLVSADGIRQSIFGIYVALMKAVQGGFFFHPQRRKSH
jgi:hypothetical protein